MTTYNSPFSGNVIQPTDVSYAEYTISSNLTLQWPVNGNDGNVAARVMEINATTSGLSVFMPPANQISVGQDALIRNIGSNTFTVKDSTSGTIIAIAAGMAEYIYVTDNSTEAGSWGIIAFGVGTSSPDASTLSGNGILPISNTLNQSHPVSSFATGYTFTAADRASAKLWTTGAGSATLPAASTLGNNWFTLLKNNGSGTLTINCTGIDLLDGLSSKTFQPNESAMIVCTGAGYVTVGYGISNTFFFTALTKNVVSGAYTLSASESSSVIQEYVGTLTGNVIVTYPPVVAFYVISNQTIAGGYTLTLTTGVPGGANATVPQGQQSTLVCDGVNFFNANTVQAGASVSNFANGSAANPSIAFASETTTGLYHPSTGEIDISISGTQTVQFNSAGVTVNGVLTAIGGITGGTF